MADGIAMYRQQRQELQSVHPGLAAMLPEDPPANDAPPMDHAAVRRHLREVANNHASFALICGWGDGTLIEAVLNDPLCSTKDLMLVCFDGEERAFAASFTRPLLQGLARSGATVLRLGCREDLQTLMNAHFGVHMNVPRLAGCDIVADHPLAPAAEDLRRRLMPELHTLLSDRPQIYGNDMGDSFVGLLNCANNAPQLLPCPDNKDLAGIYGDAPVISIAAGPSLQRHIPRLKELQGKAVLVACDAVLGGLLDAGIQPHFVTPLERLLETTAMVRRGGETSAIFAGPGVVHPKGREPFADRTVCIYGGDQVYNWLDPADRGRLYLGSSSGVLSVSLSQMLTRGPVWLVGHDLSNFGKQSHWNAADFAGDDWQQAKAQSDQGQAHWQAGYEDRWIPGNDGGMVHSVTWWDRFRFEISNICQNRNGAPVYNVNAHDRVGALIKGTEAAALPDPASLPPLPTPDLTRRFPERLAQWRRRARRLPEDGDTFQKHLRTLREDIAAARLGPAAAWPVEELAKRTTITSGVSEGNRQAFHYFLRSALHNITVEMHIRRRTANHARSRWAALESLDHVAHALDNALTTLRPALEEVADACR